MDSNLYEELCRQFIAREFAVPLESASLRRNPNPPRRETPGYTHQIDLYWEVSNNVAMYLLIATAIWCRSENINEGDWHLLQKVREKTAAHKALMITSRGFDRGTIAAAADDGIGLHVVRPSFDHASLPTRDRVAMQKAIAAIADKPCTREIIHRGLEDDECRAPMAPALAPAAQYTTRDSAGYTTREVTGPGYTDRCIGGSSGSGGHSIATRDGGRFSRDGDAGFDRR